MRRSGLIATVGVVLTAALLAAACGGGDTENVPTASLSGSPTVTPAGDAAPTLVQSSPTPTMTATPTEGFVCTGLGGGISFPINVVSSEGGVVEEIEGYQSFIWSPHGDVLALIDRGGGYGCPPVGRVTVLDVGTGAAREIVEVSVGEAAWSPDGGRLAFTTQATGSHRTVDLRVVDLEGTTGTLFEGSVSGVRWSPEGDRIAFVRSYEDDTVSELVIGTTGGEETEIRGPGDAFIGRSAWSPDGEWIAYTTYRTDIKGNAVEYDLYVAPAEGGAGKKLFSTVDTVGIPMWSPDGGRILFDVSRDAANDIYAVVVDEGAPAVRLTEGLGGKWSPDGESIAFIASWCGTFDVTVMSADGTGRANLTALPGLRTAVAWSSDGERVAFSNFTQDESRGLYTVGRDGSGLMRLTAALERVAWSADGGYIAGIEPMGRGFCE